MFVRDWFQSAEIKRALRVFLFIMNSDDNSENYF